jgi:hypothetical protein
MTKQQEAFAACLGHNRHYDKLIAEGYNVELLDKAILFGFESGQTFTGLQMLQMSDAELAERRRNLGIIQAAEPFKLEPSGTIE